MIKEVVGDAAGKVANLSKKNMAEIAIGASTALVVTIGGAYVLDGIIRRIKDRRKKKNSDDDSLDFLDEYDDEYSSEYFDSLSKSLSYADKVRLNELEVEVNELEDTVERLDDIVRGNLDDILFLLERERDRELSVEDVEIPDIDLEGIDIPDFDTLLKEKPKKKTVKKKEDDE